MELLNLDLLRDIFAFLPVRGQLNARLVCKGWYEASKKGFFTRLAIGILNNPVLIQMEKEKEGNWRSIKKKWEGLLQTPILEKEGNISETEQLEKIYKIRVLNFFSKDHALLYGAIRLKEGGIELLSVLIECGAPLCPSCLLFAIKEGTPQATELILQAGADPDRTGKNEQHPPLVYALEKWQTHNLPEHAVCLLLHNASIGAVSEEHKRLLKEGKGLGLFDKTNQTPFTPISESDTPLHIAIRYQSLGAVEVAMLTNDYLEQSNQQNETPLFLALLPAHLKQNSGFRIADALLKKGACVNTNYPWTYLHSTIFYNENTLSKHLLDKGANPNAQDELGNTPFHIAVGKNCMTSIKFLLEKGGNSNLLNQEGFSPFHLAVISQNEAAVETMLDWTQTQIDHPSREGYTALDYAVRSNNQNIAQLLISYGAQFEKLTTEAYNKLKLKVPFKPKRPSSSPYTVSNYPDHLAFYLAILGIALMTIGLRHKIWQRALSAQNFFRFNIARS